MNKKLQNTELKIYELLGVKIFRKIVLGVYKILGLPFTIFMSKEERKNFYDTPSNYKMKKGHGVQDLRDFKKMLLLNTCIHVWALFNIILKFPNIIGDAASFSTMIGPMTAGLINCYCIMLQRYNHIRINQLIKRMEPREENMKSKLKDELIKADSLLSEHTYKVVAKRDKEKDIKFEKLLETATYVELKQYRNHLLYFKKVNQAMQNLQHCQEGQYSIKVPLQKNKTLKLVLEHRYQDQSIL